MKPNENFHRNCVAFRGFIQLFSAPCSMSLVVVLLIALGNSYAQKVLSSQSAPSNSLKGHLCCPKDHFSGPDGCSPSINGTIFSPPTVKDNNLNNVSTDDVMWEFHALECSSGYEAKHYSINEVFNPLLLDDDGLYLQWNELLMQRTKNFCVNLLPSGKYVGVTCRPNMTELCTGATCIQKCCDDGEVAVFDTKSCVVSSNSTFSFEFQSESGINKSEPSNLQVLHQFPDCEEAIIFLNPEKNPYDHFNLLQNGSLYQPGKHKSFKENRFCLDYFTIQGVKGTQPAALICSENGLPTIDAYVVSSMISTVFLVVTILLHVFISKLRDVPGLCLLSYVISLLVAEMALLIAYLLRNDIYKELCVISGFILQFSLSAALFWMNVMCYDIWQTIRGTVRSIESSINQANDRKKFKIYSAFAWGGSLAFILAAIILHYLLENPEESVLPPSFGVNCWLHRDFEGQIIFSCVFVLLCIGNIFILGHTLLMLYQAGAVLLCCRRSLHVTGIFKQDHLEAFREKCVLFNLIPLFYTFEFLLWKTSSQNLGLFSVIFYKLRGVYFFIIFIMNSKKRAILKDALSRTSLRSSDATRELSYSDDDADVVWRANTSTRL